MDGKRLLASACAALALASCGGGGGGSSSPPPTSGGGTATPAPTPTPSVSLTLQTREDAAQFLQRAGFGGSEADIDALTGTSAARWLKSQMALRYTPVIDELNRRRAAGRMTQNHDKNRAHVAVWWDRAVAGNDPLRQRAIFALSQIVVSSDQAMNGAWMNGYYIDMLGQNAFGNYRDLLEDVTRTPAMSRFLTFFGKRVREGSNLQPDENYARELLQLFTIGLYELEMDGLRKLDASGDPIETYSNVDIEGLAKVFTGYDYQEKVDDTTHQHSPIVATAKWHSTQEKWFLGKTIPAGTDAETSLQTALDHIFAHKNVAPFVARQLIQRFTQSAPPPGYIERVARAFETGRFLAADNTSFGTGQRGDLAATFAAVLLDEQFFDDIAPTAQEGKIREPVLRFVHWARAMEVDRIDSTNEWWLIYDLDRQDRLGQSPFGSPSVFNFYRPGNIATGTKTGDAGLTAPELQIMNETTHSGFANFMFQFVFDASPMRVKEQETYRAAYDDERAVAEDAEALADHLDAKLMGGAMRARTRANIVDAVNAIPIREREDQRADDITARARLAVYFAVTAPEFAIQY